MRRSSSLDGRLLSAWMLTAVVVLGLAGCTTTPVTTDSASTLSTSAAPTTSAPAPTPAATDSVAPTSTAVKAGPLPNAGTLYVTTKGDAIAVIEPGARTATMIEVGSRPGVAVVAPAGTPNAGTAYVTNRGDGTMSVIPPGSTEVRATFEVGDHPSDPVIAPAGAANAGTVYVASRSGGLSALAPGATTVSTIDVGEKPVILAIAPSGTPQAGTLYLKNTGAFTLTALSPDGAGGAVGRETEISVGFGLKQVFVAPAGTPAAGTLYLTFGGDGRVVVVLPDLSDHTATYAAGAGPNHGVTIDDGAVAFAPAGTPNAGSVLIGLHSERRVSVFAPGSSTATPVKGGARIDGGAVVAPAGSPNAGTFYVLGTLAVMVIPPGATTGGGIGTGEGANDLVMAPAGTPEAGTVYLTFPGGKRIYGYPRTKRWDLPAQVPTSVKIIPAGATTVQTQIKVPGASMAVVAGADTPIPGTVYVIGGHTVSVILPGASTVRTTIDLGKARSALVSAIVP